MTVRFALLHNIAAPLLKAALTTSDMTEQQFNCCFGNTEINFTSKQNSTRSDGYTLDKNLTYQFIECKTAPYSMSASALPTDNNNSDATESLHFMPAVKPAHITGKLLPWWGSAVQLICNIRTGAAAVLAAPCCTWLL